MANEIKIRVPATTANCGAGFDCLGIACTYYNLFTFEVTQEAEIKVQATGEGAEFFSPTATNLAIDSLLYVFKKYNLIICKISYISYADALSNHVTFADVRFKSDKYIVNCLSFNDSISTF